MVEEGSQSKQVEAPPSIEVIIIYYLFTRYMIDIRKLGSYKPGVASGGSLVAIDSRFKIQKGLLYLVNGLGLAMTSQHYPVRIEH